jgi:hypothetical protein
MKNRKCPNHKHCLDYKCGACETCHLGNEILKLHKRIDRLKKQNETLTIQRNAWALTAKALREEWGQGKYEKIIAMFSPHEGKFLDFKAEEVIQGPNDRALFGFDTNFPLEWLVEDYGFTEEEARWFISEVHRLHAKKEDANHES